ncbi:SOS response-associated peptidase [Shewanella sp. Isolate8]|uniref:SOS response-associated peptidase n=1 Tax=Shewanella sp. Isolate8 TaxID=2908529 RepID=UPI001EFE4D33|nr:SOS response-associated peptidase [Shewanella sp. Isolate8]MCG9747550.1 SOS response-associated peptidase [Shewanella sp. Isolate8]
MCGRLNVISDPLCDWVSGQLGIKFHSETNRDLRPTQRVATLASDGMALNQVDASWGIKPDWAKRLLINAQAETVREKPTFAQAFAHHRVVVPCSGWYEWQQANGAKQKYLFQRRDGQPLLMAGLVYPQLDGDHALVTLTTKPIASCSPYHHRMPLLVEPQALDFWFGAAPHELDALLSSPDIPLSITSC